MVVAEEEQNDPLDSPSAPPPGDGGHKRKVIKKRVGHKHRQEELEQPDEFMEVGGTVVDWVIDNLRIVGPVLCFGLLALLVLAVLKLSIH